MTDYFKLGSDFGALCHQYQPAPLVPPVNLVGLTQEQFEFFWAGYEAGWDKAEASSVIFFKVNA